LPRLIPASPVLIVAFSDPSQGWHTLVWPSRRPVRGHATTFLLPFSLLSPFLCHASPSTFEALSPMTLSVPARGRRWLATISLSVISYPHLREMLFLRLASCALIFDISGPLSVVHTGTLCYISPANIYIPCGSSHPAPLAGASSYVGKVNILPSPQHCNLSFRPGHTS
jgi:hypothetical protein